MAWKDSLEENEIEESGGEKKSGAAKPSQRSIMPTLLIGLWLVALTVLLVFLFIKTPSKLTESKPAGNTVTKKINPPDAGGVSDGKVVEVMDKMNNLDKKIVQVEDHIKNLENNIGERISQIEKQGRDFGMLIERVDKLESTVLSIAKAEASEKIPEKVTDAVKTEQAAPGDATEKNLSAGSAPRPEPTVVPSETKPSVSGKSPEKRAAAAVEAPEKRRAPANPADKKRVAGKAKDKKRIASADKSVKKKKPIRNIDNRTYKSPMEREDAAAAYWLKINKPDYSPEDEAESEPVYGKSVTAESSSSGYQTKKNETSDLPVEIVSGSGSGSSGTNTEASVKSPETQIPGVKSHQIGQGDTVYSIGKEYNMSSKEIFRMNRVPRGASFYAGDRVLVLRDGGFDHVGPYGTINQVGRQYDPVYGMPENEINRLTNLAPGLGIYADWVY